MGATSAGDARERDLEERILEATTRCVARWGVAKTTVDDIARDAGCSRATVYRVLPGGKQELLVGAAQHEVGRVVRSLDSTLAACADLRSVVVTLVHEGARAITGNAALAYLCEHEPEVILPHVSFDRFEPVLHRAAELAVGHLRPHLDERPGWRTGEGLARLVASYVFGDGTTADLTDPTVAAHLVDTFVMPGLATSGPAPSPGAVPAAVSG